MWCYVTLSLNMVRPLAGLTSMLLNLSNTQPQELLYDEHQAARKLNKTGILLKFYSHLPQ